MVISVKTFRAAGLEAKWSKTRAGRPVMVCRYPLAKYRHQRETWWVVDSAMVRQMERQGIVEGFDSCTLLGDMFSI